MRPLLPFLLLGPPAAAQAPFVLPQAGDLAVRTEIVGRADECRQGDDWAQLFVRI